MGRGGAYVPARMCGLFMGVGRGGACVPARIAQQGRIRRSSPAHNACVLGMETPLRGRSGGHTGTAPTVSFGWLCMDRHTGLYLLKNEMFHKKQRSASND